MTNKILRDLILLVSGVVLAVFLVRAGIAEQFVIWLDGWSWLGVVVAGMLFTSVFTTGSAIVLLGTFAETTPLPVLAVFGGLGAVLGDYIIFRFVKDRLSEDLEYLLSFSGKKRLSAIFRTQFFRLLVPFLGALVIASPLPDEIGVAMLGLSKVRNRVFLPLSFVLNGVGILVVGWIAKSVAAL